MIHPKHIKRYTHVNKGKYNIVVSSDGISKVSFMDMCDFATRKDRNPVSHTKGSVERNVVFVSSWKNLMEGYGVSGLICMHYYRTNITIQSVCTRIPLGLEALPETGLNKEK